MYQNTLEFYLINQSISLPYNFPRLTSFIHIGDQSGGGGGGGRSRHVGTFRALSTGLEPIPENDVTEMSMVFQPLVPPAVPKPPATTSYNIRHGVRYCDCFG